MGRRGPKERRLKMQGKGPAGKVEGARKSPLADISPAT